MGPLPTLVTQADRQLYNVMRRDAVVRGLLGVGAAEARTILEALVGRGLLQPEGERRGRRYLTARQPEDEG